MAIVIGRLPGCEVFRVLEVLKQIQHVLVVSVQCFSAITTGRALARAYDAGSGLLVLRQRRRLLGSVCTSQGRTGLLMASHSHPQCLGSRGKERLPVAFIIGLTGLRKKIQELL